LFASSFAGVSRIALLYQDLEVSLLTRHPLFARIGSVWHLRLTYRRDAGGAGAMQHSRPTEPTNQESDSKIEACTLGLPLTFAISFAVKPK
jgi:hypothetical protein